MSDTEIKYKEFLKQLFAQMSTGNFTVNVKCENNECHNAEVIGHDDSYMTVKVRYHSDNLTKPGMVREQNETNSWTDYDNWVIAQIPVKEDNIHWTHIKL